MINSCRFLGTNSRFIPAHSAKECVDSMITIAKVCAVVNVCQYQKQRGSFSLSTVSPQSVLRASKIEYFDLVICDKCHG